MSSAIRQLRIRLMLRDNGWADCSVSTPDGVFEIGSFGDCTDAFGDLLRAALLIATGATTASVSFDGEPMEWRWIIERRLFDDLLVKVATLPDIYAHSPDAEGDLVFSTECSPDDFAKAVAEAAQGLLDEVGLVGFANRWRLTGFPTRALRALQTALAIAEPEPMPTQLPEGGGWTIIGPQD
jgi:hypothetical protein